MGDLPAALLGLPAEHAAEARRSWDRAVAQRERFEALNRPRYESATALEKAVAVWDPAGLPPSVFLAPPPAAEVGPIYVCSECGSTSEAPGFCTGGPDGVGHAKRTLDRVE